MSGLVSLKTLDVRDNPKLKRIPKEIAQLRGLETLLLDEKHINYPDPEIVSKGTEAIMRFLCSGKYDISLTIYCLITMMDVSNVLNITVTNVNIH